MKNLLLTGNLLSGVYEIDADGILIYSSVKSADGEIKRDPDPKGIDFFREVMLFKNATDFQRRFDSFREANVPSESFDFTCSYETRKLTIRVLLARLVDSASSCSFLVYIRNGAGNHVEL